MRCRRSHSRPLSYLSLKDVFHLGRRGVEYLELVLVLPILFIATIAMFEFGILMLYQSTVTSAAIEGAREAAKSTSDTDVAVVVQNFLSHHNVTFDTTGPNALVGGGNAFVLIERGGTAATRGDSTLTSNAIGPVVLTSDEIRVTVNARLVVANDKPVPNWLNTVGLNLSLRTMKVSSLALQE